MKRYIWHLLAAAAAIPVSCNTKVEKSESQLPVKTYTGDYVSDGYAQRDEGYDWSVVSIEQSGDSTFNISVRSRADIKKESCSFNAAAVLSATGDTLISRYDDANIYFTVSADTLTISSDTPSILYFFCSGGATLAGEYVRLHEKLETRQLADTIRQSNN